MYSRVAQWVPIFPCKEVINSAPLRMQPPDERGMSHASIRFHHVALNHHHGFGVFITWVPHRRGNDLIEQWVVNLLSCVSVLCIAGNMLHIQRSHTEYLLYPPACPSGITHSRPCTIAFGRQSPAAPWNIPPSYRSTFAEILTEHSLLT